MGRYTLFLTYSCDGQMFYEFHEGQVILPNLFGSELCAVRLREMCSPTSRRNAERCFREDCEIEVPKYNVSSSGLGITPYSIEKTMRVWGFINPCFGNQLRLD